MGSYSREDSLNGSMILIHTPILCEDSRVDANRGAPLAGRFSFDPILPPRDLALPHDPTPGMADCGTPRRDRGATGHVLQRLQKNQKVSQGPQNQSPYNSGTMPDHVWWVAKCKGCGEWMILQHGGSMESGTIAAMPDFGPADIRCSQCGHFDHYSGRELIQRLGPPPDKEMPEP
jgi:hypothetical protein